MEVMPVSDVLTKEQRHLNMSHMHGKDTKPEESVRKYLLSMGYRYRKNDNRYPGRPDIVLPKYYAVIFVHGCFCTGIPDADMRQRRPQTVSSGRRSSPTTPSSPTSTSSHAMTKRASTPLKRCATSSPRSCGRPSPTAKASRSTPPPSTTVSLIPCRAARSCASTRTSAAGSSPSAPTRTSPPTSPTTSGTPTPSSKTNSAFPPPRPSPT